MALSLGKTHKIIKLSSDYLLGGGWYIDLILVITFNFKLLVGLILTYNKRLLSNEGPLRPGNKLTLMHVMVTTFC
jgi:hypothetical protein